MDNAWKSFKLFDPANDSLQGPASKLSPCSYEMWSTLLLNSITGKHIGQWERWCSSEIPNIGDYVAWTCWLGWSLNLAWTCWLGWSLNLAWTCWLGWSPNLAWTCWLGWSLNLAWTYFFPSKAETLTNLFSLLGSMLPICLQFRFQSSSTIPSLIQFVNSSYVQDKVCNLIHLRVMREQLVLLRLLYNFKEWQTVLPLVFHVKSCTFAIIVPTTYRYVSDCELCLVYNYYKTSSQTTNLIFF